MLMMAYRMIAMHSEGKVVVIMARTWSNRPVCAVPAARFVESDSGESSGQHFFVSESVYSADDHCDYAGNEYRDVRILTPSQYIVCDHDHKEHQDRQDRRDNAGHAPG